jgi:hypothetical protein
MKLSVHPRIETEEDLQLVKDYILFPILLDMLNRDMAEIKIYSDRIIFSHLISYLNDLENFVFNEIQRIKTEMKKRDIKILTEEKGNLGVSVDYKVRGYVHNFSMLRSLVKADIMVMLWTMGNNYNVDL